MEEMKKMKKMIHKIQKKKMHNYLLRHEFFLLDFRLKK